MKSALIATLRGMQPQHRRRLVTLTVVGAGAVMVLAVAQLIALVRDVQARPPIQEQYGLAAAPALLADTAPPQRERTVDTYFGYGTWVDVYDFRPPADGSGVPKLSAASVDEMARQGVQTLYLQAAQLDDASSGLLVDPSLVAQILVRAQRAGISVVGWYLPRFSDIDRDLAHLRAISDFEVLGHRFDGVAVDIEWTGDVPDHAERSNKLVELSEQLRAGIDHDPLGAIVLPPVQIEVVNTSKWPDFPWQELAGLYDVWLPMGYWTERRADSGYRDGATYTEENVRRLREDLDDPDALVHAIGGIGDEVTAPQAARFAQAIDEVNAVGGSIYDWDTLALPLHETLASRLGSDPGH
jgi:hypothetical protein